ncbi:MAG: response regulator [Betaproteobacteria bacterium]|nr:response regulator [Betaproteobacteria bacterium]
MNPDSLLAALDEPVFEIEPGGTVTFATATFGVWTDRAQDETGYAFAETIRETDRTRFQQMVKRIAEGKTADALVEATLLSNGTPVEIKLARGRREGDKVLTIAGWLRDLTMEKAREAAANVQGTHLLDLVENVSDAAVVENAEGGVEMVNSAFCDLFHVEAAAQSLVGMDCAELFAMAAKSTDQQIAPIYFPLDSAKADRFEFQFTGGTRAEQHSMPVMGESGIAGRLHLFRALGAANAAAPAKAASATTSAQSQTVEKIARNLATAVENAGSAIHRAEQLDLPGGVIEHFRRVEDATSTAFNEIAGLLDFSQIASAEVKLVPAEFHLRESVASMFDNVVADAEAHRVQLNLSVEQDVPEFLMGDGARLMLVLRSHIEAAIPSVPGGELKLVIEPEYSTEKDTHLSFRVEAAPPKGGTRNKSVSPSHLMQLSLARQIVRAMSEKGNGKIEAREKKETQIQQFTAVFGYRPGREARHRAPVMTLTSMPVLIVSADAAQRKELSDLAKSWRMQPREADSAAVALQFLARMAHEETPVPLVLTANAMPAQDGFLLAFRIRYHAKLRGTAVMMIANSGKPGDAIACRENGISAYLRQPIAPNQINEAIFAVMGVQDEGDEASSTLITRHSLREMKAGSVLVIDPNREHALIAVPTLKKKDYRVVHADTAEEAWREIAQDVFDLIILDPMAKGFAELGIEGIADELTKRFANSGKTIPVLLAVEDDISAVEYGFSGMIKKPYEKDDLLKKVAALVPVKAAD